MKANAYLPLKRLADLVFALTLGLVLLPVLVGLAIAIRLESPGPAIFKQARMGRGGKPFTIYKFRSMVANAPKLGPELTERNDPRITHLGRLLRRTSVDEFPQLLNILKGDMSFIGPRPEVPSIVETDWSEDDRETVLSVRPGLSGWAQIHGRDDLDIPTKLRYDREYAERVSLPLDLTILWRTPWLLLTGRGIK
ncbi:UDP-N-acetylgalactosamine-undecaprenyl-phosphate N-acetylgalactosaminephosphotransferase [compost metagenome]